VHGGKGEAMTRAREMEEQIDKGKKEDALDPIMMEEYQIKEILEITRKTCNGVPYQYKMNNKKRAITDREDLESDEEEVGDLWAMEKIGEILHETYEIKKRGPRTRNVGINSIHVSVCVEPTNPCATNTTEIKPPFRQPNFSGRNTT
jgi:hypothetical protein